MKIHTDCPVDQIPESNNEQRDDEMFRNMKSIAYLSFHSTHFRNAISRCKCLTWIVMVSVVSSIWGSKLLLDVPWNLSVIFCPKNTTTHFIILHPEKLFLTLWHLLIFWNGYTFLSLTHAQKGTEKAANNKHWALWWQTCSFSLSFHGERQVEWPFLQHQHGRHFAG